MVAQSVLRSYGLKRTIHHTTNPENELVDAVLMRFQHAATHVRLAPEHESP